MYPLRRFQKPIRSHGVALIEAMIALLVMAFGMLALVGVQATLHLNSDVAKQRAEATRIAAAEMEQVRSFISVAAVNGTPNVSWDEIATRSVSAVAQADGTSSATFSLTRTVAAQGATQKSIHIVVNWTDRSNQAQSVTLDGAVSAVSPALASLLRVPTTPSSPTQRSGRQPTIPPVAKNLDNGTSAFKPVEAGTVSWIFNNSTGVIVSFCTGTTGATAALTTGNLGTCTTTNALLLAGVVSFNLRGAEINSTATTGTSVIKPAAGGTMAWVMDNSNSRINQSCSVTTGATSANLASGGSALSACVSVNGSPTISPVSPTTDSAYTLVASDSEAPIWPALNFSVALQSATGEGVASSTCYANAPSSAAAAAAQTTVSYYCAVVPSNANGWGGQLNLTPAGFSDGGSTAWTLGTTSADYKVCRYTSASTGYTANTNHPAYFCKVLDTSCSSKVKVNLVNENFLVIAGTKSCPTDVAATPLTGDLVNTKTLQHQP